MSNSNIQLLINQGKSKNKLSYRKNSPTPNYYLEKKYFDVIVPNDSKQFQLFFRKAFVIAMIMFRFLEFFEVLYYFKILH